MRTLYLARHGAAAGEGDLTEAGHEQARLLGRRLAEVPLTAVWHSPLPRAEQTVAELGLPAPASASALLGDHLPSRPAAAELAPGFAPAALEFVAGFGDGPAGVPGRAVEEFSQPVARADLLVTHSQVVAWFVRDALGAPEARWLGLNAANAALTVIQYRAGHPPALVMFNDQSHLPAALRWTGFAEERRALWA